MASDAENICQNPTPEVLELAAEVGEVGKRARSDAFRFERCDDGSTYEIRVPARSGGYVLTPVDEYGNPSGVSIPQPDTGPYLVSRHLATPPPKPVREMLKDELREEMGISEPEPKPPGKIARFFKGEQIDETH